MDKKNAGSGSSESSGSGGWQLGDDGPEAYETFVVPAYTGIWADEIVDRACLRPGEKVIDVACGTGLVARRAAGILGGCERVHGIDVNGAMIKKAGEIERGIKWQHCDVTGMPFPDNHFDVVFCQQGLQYFPDPSLALNKMHRVLAENGRILLTVWRPVQYSPFYDSLCSVLGKYLDGKAAAMLSAAFEFGGPGKLKSLFADAGFRAVDISIVIKQMCCSPFDAFISGSMTATPFFQEIRDMPAERREEMFLEIYNLNRDYIDDNGMVAPTESYMVHAIK